MARSEPSGSRSVLLETIPCARRELFLLSLVPSTLPSWSIAASTTTRIPMALRGLEELTSDEVVATVAAVSTRVERPAPAAPWPAMPVLPLRGLATSTRATQRAEPAETVVVVDEAGQLATVAARPAAAVAAVSTRVEPPAPAASRRAMPVLPRRGLATSTQATERAEPAETVVAVDGAGQLAARSTAALAARSTAALTAWDAIAEPSGIPLRVPRGNGSSRARSTPRSTRRCTTSICSQRHRGQLTPFTLPVESSFAT